ncbi:MAG TPA: acyltransferase [Pelobium sp.]|nr:acyltransferase [Pelobium sp.]
MQRIPSLDGLRAISIFIVILAHFNHFWHLRVLDLLVNAGIVGVYIFFVISGFLITTLLFKEKNKSSSVDLKKFYIRRILRIVPLSIIYVIAIIIISLCIHKPEIRENYWIPALYLSNISGLGTVSYVFIHYWSLSAEEQYYVLIPSFFKLNTKRFKQILILIFLSSFIFRLLNSQFNDIFVLQLFTDITRNLDGLIIGSYLAVVYYENKIPVEFFTKYKHIINVVGFALILFLNHETDIIYLKIFANHSFYSFIIAVLIIANIQPSNDYFYKFLNHRFIVKIGVISYSIYIWQQLFSSGIIPLPSYVNLALALLTAFVSYYFLETPFLKVKNKFKIV